MIDRVLIVGLGSIGKRHLKLTRELLPDAQIIVLRHKPTYKLPQYSDGVVNSVEDAIKFCPQAAIIANPAPYHLSTAQKLAENGTHLLIEKPLSTSIDRVNHLIETCRNRNITLAVGYNLRFSPSLLQYKNLLDEKIIGALYSVRCEVGQFLPNWRPQIDYRDSVSARKVLGGGVLLELSHEIDYLRWVFGEIDWVSAVTARSSDLEIDVEDTAHVVLGFVGGEVSRTFIGTLNADFIRHDTKRECVAIGDAGSLRWNGLTGQIEFYRAGARSWECIYEQCNSVNDTYIEELKDFFKSTVTRGFTRTNGEDGKCVLEIIEAVRMSSASGGVKCKVMASE